MEEQLEEWRKKAEVREKEATELPKLTRWVDYQMMEPKPIDWVVEKWLSAGDITILSAEGGTGKSWKAAHIALKVAAENETMVDGAFPVRKKGNVLWFDNENGPEENRVRCFKLDREIGFKELRFKEHHVAFHERHWCADEAGEEKMRALVREWDPVLIVIDSLVSVFPPGMSENNAIDVRTVMDRITDVLRFDDEGKPREKKIAALALHHTKKESQQDQDADGWPTYRGSTDFKNAATYLVIMRAKDVEGKDGKERRIQNRWVKSRRGRMEEGIYEFALKDHGEMDTPEHWVEYVTYGKARDFCEYLVDKLRECFAVGTEFTQKDLSERINGFPDHREKGHRWVQKFIEMGVVTQTSVGEGRKASKYAVVSAKNDVSPFVSHGSEKKEEEKELF